MLETAKNNFQKVRDTMEIPREEGNGSQRWVLAIISLMRSAREVAGPNANACMHADSDKTGDWRTFGGTSPVEKKAKGGLDRHPNGKVNHGALPGLLAAVRASGSSWNSLVHHMSCVTSIVPSARRGRYPRQGVPIPKERLKPACVTLLTRHVDEGRNGELDGGR